MVVGTINERPKFWRMMTNFLANDDQNFSNERPKFWQMKDQNFGEPMTNFLANERPIFWRTTNFLVISDQFFGHDNL